MNVENDLLNLGERNPSATNVFEYFGGMLENLRLCCKDGVAINEVLETILSGELNWRELSLETVLAAGALDAASALTGKSFDEILASLEQLSLERLRDEVRRVAEMASLPELQQLIQILRATHQR